MGLKLRLKGDGGGAGRHRCKRHVRLAGLLLGVRPRESDYSGGRGVCGRGRALEELRVSVLLQVLIGCIERWGLCRHSLHKSSICIGIYFGIWRL